MNKDPYLLSLQLKIDLAEILNEPSEMAKLISLKRNWLIDQILKTPEKEIDYFDDETSR